MVRASGSHRGGAWSVVGAGVSSSLSHAFQCVGRGARALSDVPNGVYFACVTCDVVASRGGGVVATYRVDVGPYERVHVASNAWQASAASSSSGAVQAAPQEACLRD